MTGDNNVFLPAFPIRIACNKMMSGFDDDSTLKNMNEVVSMYYNASKEKYCLEIPQDDSYGDVWDISVCLQNFPQESILLFEIYFHCFQLGIQQMEKLICFIKEVSQIGCWLIGVLRNMVFLSVRKERIMSVNSTEIYFFHT